MNLSFSQNDRILIDANVLIYVYCPLNGRSYEGFIILYKKSEMQNLQFL